MMMLLPAFTVADRAVYLFGQESHEVQTVLQQQIQQPRDEELSANTAQY
jgi:hypothetical protein